MVSLVIFNIYMHPQAECVREHELKCQHYADKTVLTTVIKMAHCLDEISLYMNHSWLNLSKTEVLLVDKESTMKSLQPQCSLL